MPSLGGDVCQQLIGWKILKLKIMEIKIYLVVYIIIISIIIICNSRKTITQWLNYD